MDRRLADAIGNEGQLAPLLRGIALAESGGDPTAFNPEGGSWGAVGAFQMRKGAMLDTGETPATLRDNPERQTRAAALYLRSVILPAIYRAGKPATVYYVAQAWHDGPATLAREPWGGIEKWVKRATGGVAVAASRVRRRSPVAGLVLLVIVGGVFYARETR